MSGVGGLVNNDVCVVEFVVTLLLNEDFGLLDDFHYVGGNGA